MSLQRTSPLHKLTAIRSRYRLMRREELLELMKRITAWFDAVSGRIAPIETDPLSSPVSIARKPIIYGAWMVFWIFGVFGLWAAIAPLDSAAVAPGSVILDSNKKTIQHLEGGIVEDILVHEGERVEASQPLIRLNETATKARLDLFKGQFLAFKAAEARLMAERDGLEKIGFPKEVTAVENTASVKEIINSQRNLFKSRRESVSNQTQVLNQKIAQHQQEINGLAAQEKSATDQIGFLKEEIAVVRKLLEQGNAMKPRLLALERTAAELEGRRGENKALISRAKQSIAEAEFQIASLKSEFQAKINQELKETQVQLGDLEEKLRASVDVMDRITITAPIAGIITGLNVHTKGGVVAPGEKLMDIVPTHDKLIVEAKVSTQDIDVVHSGLEARVRLTAYKSRSVPTFTGKVINISADRFEDQRLNVAYYLARVEVSPEDLEKHRNVELYPGMPADVLIITGERTLLSYMMAPITDALNHAFREE